MDDSKTIKGQAWIIGDKLIQEQILLLTNGNSSTNNVAIIDDIWKNLVDGSETYPVKYNDKKNYFYWEYQMTDTLDDTTEITVKFECPTPKEGLFTEPYDPSTAKTEWAKYWLTKYKTTQDNAKIMNIQKTEYTLPGSKILNFGTGLQETQEDITFKNNDIGDISNLLSMF